ncbi:MAG TPA: class I SAM-dependent methyltransferase [Acidimicrobiales bacterium]|nr:class I SAM-dependent methyltransferase [Acidimicrobiales bacterium]
MGDDRYYRPALARIHHEGFGFHADACAPGILALLEDVRRRDGLVIEVGCGSGLLTRHLLDAGHRVIATDASPAMVDLARSYAPEALEHRVLALPDDPLLECDALVSTGHALSYLPDRPTLETALVACARALRPGGVLALDLEDLSTRDAQMARPPTPWFGTEWALITERASDAPDHFARLMTTFVRRPDGTYERGFERHDNVLVDVEGVVRPLLEAEGLTVDIGLSFGDEVNMEGLLVVVAHRPTA